MKALRLSLLALGLTASALAQATTITGDWKLALDVSGNGAEDTCKFTQDKDNKITGTCNNFTNVVGKVEGDKVTIDMTGSQASVTLTGKLKDGKIAGTILVKDYGMEGSFTMAPTK